MAMMYKLILKQPFEDYLKWHPRVVSRSNLVDILRHIIPLREEAVSYDRELYISVPYPYLGWCDIHVEVDMVLSMIQTPENPHTSLEPNKHRPDINRAFKIVGLKGKLQDIGKKMAAPLLKTNIAASLLREYEITLKTLQQEEEYLR